MKKSLWGCTLLCILSFASIVVAQVATTSLRGVIKDPSGALVPGAKVTITDNATGRVQSTAANTAGQYEFLQIEPAKYTIKVTAVGFGDQSKSAELLVNQPATIDFALSVQASSVTVDVSGIVQTLNTTDASLGNADDNALIQAIPSETRNVPDLLSLQPGVFYMRTDQQSYGMGDSRTGAVNGSRSDQGNVTLDGVDDNDQIGGFAFTGVLRTTQDSIEEFRVTTGDSNADSGRSSGAQISMVTKSGTNKFHGAAYEYNRTSLGEANNWFVKQAELGNNQKNVPPKLIRNIYGADLGGPLKKDKLFFFGNYEAERHVEDQQVTQTAPTAPYQAGNITYYSGGNPVMLTPAQLTALDAGCLVCNSSIYSSGPGPNPNSLALFNQMPAANGTVNGDGVNEGSYTFSSPAPIHLNTSIVKFDWVPSDKHRLFVRGNLQDDATAFPEHFPGQPPSSSLLDNSKGLTTGETWTISSRLINDLRYGYVRQGFVSSGVGKGEYVDFRFLNSPTAETRNSITNVPVNNIVDNLSWTKGNHSLGFGANWRLIHQNHAADGNSYNSATTNPYWLHGNAPGEGMVDSGFANSYEEAFANLVGTVPQITDVFNYKLTSPTAGTALSEGASIPRHFSANELEYYIQDAWRIKPNLTITFGIRHSLLQTPYETDGQEVTPTIDTHTWFLQRESAAQAGQIYEPDITFAPAGKFFSKPGYWPMNKNNIAPRLAIAYSPDSKTSIRMGAGIYYDHYGEALVNTFSNEGSFGMSSSISNPAGVYAIEGNVPFCGTPGCNGTGQFPGAARFTGRSDLPPISVGSAPTNITYPYLYPQDNFSIQWGLDSKIKTPYSETFDFSVQREVPGGFTVEAAYVGRLGRHLLQQLDLAEPVDYVDPAGAGDYYAAGTMLSHQVDLNNGNPNAWANVPTIQYFEDVFPFMAGVGPGTTATQNIYANEWAPYRAQYGATTSLSDIDFYCAYGCPANWQSHFWQDQFSSLYALSSIGMSYYNSGQFTVRHPAAHGLTVDFSLTWSHSIDDGSDTERSNEFGGFGSNTGSFSAILNTWKPHLNRGNSDFDTKELITADGVYQLPFGRGKALAGSANRFVDAIIGGWQWSGVNRWSSGLPWSIFEPGWTTDWQIESFAVKTGAIATGKHYVNGNPTYLVNPTAVNNGAACGGCGGGNIRLPYPGEAGMRNPFRGDGYFELDSGVSKNWKLAEFGTLKFAWEDYNVTNSVRFDPADIGGQLTGGNLGVANGLLNTPRRMQFALRVDF